MVRHKGEQDLTECKRLDFEPTHNATPDADLERLNEELRVHQVELEHQNEQLRRTQLELEESRDRYRNLYDNAPVGYLSLTRKGTVRRANLCAARLLGLARAELEGVPLQRMMDRPGADRLHLHLQRVIVDGEPESIEIELLRADEQRIWVEFQSVPCDEGDGHGLGCRTTFSDASERRLLESQRSEQLVGRLASGVAHEFNNLLMGILGCASSALLDLEQDSRAAALLLDLKGEAVRGATLTRQLLELGGISEVHAVIDVNAVVAQNERLLRHTLGPGTTLSFSLQAQDGHVWIDRGQLGQVLSNLVVNARDATVVGGGHIEIATAATSLDANEARARGMDPGRYVALTVIDDGEGMDASVQARLFEPFFTTKLVGEGTGLGLSVAHHIVHQAKGHIEVESLPGVGTTARVLLPLAARPRDRAPSLLEPREEDLSPVALSNDETVLVVEDEPLVRHTVCRYLLRGGYRVVEASHAAEALAILEARADIQLLLSDVVLPGLDGPELARMATELRPQLRVLFMSAYPKVKLVRERGFAADAPTLQKPFTARQLLVKLRALLETEIAQHEPKAPRLPAVLVADDNVLVAESVAEALRQDGFAVHTAKNGVLALELFDTHRPELVCVILDVSMPRMGAERTFEELEARGSEVPVLLFSGYGEHEWATRFEAMGFAGYIQKPCNLTTLSTLVRQVVAGDDNPSEELEG